MDASPSKRRVLGLIDGNTKSPALASRLPASKLDVPKAQVSVSPSSIKRPLDQENIQQSHPPAKKPRISSTLGSSQPTIVHEDVAEKQPDDAPRQRSNSPADSSLFDNSVNDTSNATAITEPEVEAVAVPLPLPPPPPRQPAMTREEARQKAEILRLRLGLASYKVRTNQIDLPLEKLQPKPLPGQKVRPRLPRLPSSSHTIPGDDDGSQGKKAGLLRKALPSAPLQRGNSFNKAQSQAHASPEKKASPKLPAMPLNTPRRTLVEDEDKLPGSGLRGGAAKGLLSLCRG